MIIELYIRLTIPVHEPLQDVSHGIHLLFATSPCKCLEKQIIKMTQKSDTYTPRLSKSHDVTQRPSKSKFTQDTQCVSLGPQHPYLLSH